MLLSVTNAFQLVFSGKNFIKCVLEVHYHIHISNRL